MRLLTQKKLTERVLTELGDSQTTVELVSGDWDSIFQRTLEKYAIFLPKMLRTDLQILQGVQDYKLAKSVVGNGVWDVIEPSAGLGEIYMGFTSEYFPYQMPGGAILEHARFQEWRVHNKAQQQVYGVEFQWEYISELNALRVYPKPVKNVKTTLLTMHPRQFTSGTAGNGSGTTAFTGTLKDADGFALTNIATGCVEIYTDGSDPEIFIDQMDGTMASNNGGTGTINYRTGEVALTFNASVDSAKKILFELCEIRKEHYSWYGNYVSALAKIIVGYKRARFGNIPGQQLSISLDTAIKTDGGDALKALEEESKIWITEFLIPRQL
jgi:hypothetical protein